MGGGNPVPSTRTRLGNSAQPFREEQPHRRSGVATSRCCLLGDISQSARVTTWFRRDFVTWEVGTVHDMGDAKTPLLPSVLPSRGFHGLTQTREVSCSHPQHPCGFRHLSFLGLWKTPALIYHVSLNALESLSPNLSALLKLVLERALPSCLDAATVFWVSVSEALLFVGTAWMGFEHSFTFFSPQSGLGFHSVTSALCWPGNYVVDVSLFLAGIRKSSI